MGNAWFVSAVQEVENADEEIEAIGHADLATTAVVDQMFANIYGDYRTDTINGAIQLVTYKPNQLVYESTSTQEQIAVFSDIYYPKGWNCYIDGKAVDHFRANYVLRAAMIPAGDHTIEFKFEPTSYKYGKLLAMISSIIVLRITSYNVCYTKLLRTAINYNMDATADNGSCIYSETDIIYGCMNPDAINYKPDANVPDGSCVFPKEVYGCTNPKAFNYFPEATVEDGSCIFDETGIVYGCMNPDADNYNPTANIEDGTCIFPDEVWGCMKPGALNYNPDATKSDGSCIFDQSEVIFGCMDPKAFNYMPDANYDNGTCIYQMVIYGCTVPHALNYYPVATVDDGSCIFDETGVVFGCMNRNNFV